MMVVVLGMWMMKLITKPGTDVCLHRQAKAVTLKPRINICQGAHTPSRTGCLLQKRIYLHSLHLSYEFWATDPVNSGYVG